MKKSLIFCLFLSLFSISLFAQLLPIRNYSTQNGLAQNQIINIYQDKQGYLWFQTNGGMSKFDGYNFENYSLANGLASNNLKSFQEFKDKIFFIGDDTFSILKNGEIRSFNQTYLSNLLQEKVQSVVSYNDSTAFYIFLATQSKIYFYDTEKNSFKLFFNLRFIPEKITNFKTVFSIPDLNHIFLQYENNSYLVNLPKKKITNISKKLQLNQVNGDVLRLFSFDNKANNDDFIVTYTDKINNTSTWYHYKEQRKSYTQLLKSKKIISLYAINKQNEIVYYEDKQENMHLITSEGRIFLYNYKTNQGKYSSESIDSKNIDLTQMSDAYYLDKKIWISSNQGLLEYDISSKTINTYSTYNGLSNNNIQIMFIDKEHNIWLGTNGTGVDMIVPGNITNYTEKNGLSHSGSTNTVEGKDGSIWVSTDNGITRILPNGKYTYYTTAQGLPHNDIWALAMDHKGKIWVGTYNNGIVMFDGNKFINKRPKELPFNGTYTTEIFVDSEANIWIPNAYNIIKYDKDYNYKVFPNIQNSPIYQIIEDESGLLWFAGSNSGLSVYNKKGAFIANYPIDNNVFNSNIIAIEIINKDFIWCYTYGEGIIQFNRHSHRYKRIFIKELAGYEINKAYVRDNNKNLWLSTINGIIKISKNNLQIFSKEDGLVGNDVRTTGAYKDSKGILWFNTSFGLVRINPTEQFRDQTAPSMIITEFSVNAKKQNTLINRSFKHNQNNVIFKFVGLDYRNPNRVKYQYFLKNFDQDWSANLNDRSVRYTNLNPGKYTFFVRAIDHSGNISKTSEVSFTILSPFWETWWFRSFALLLIGYLIWIIVQYRMKKLKRRNEELENLVAIRTKQLRERNEQMISSIRYAERIQKALLPSESFLKNIFADIFVIFMPKDIISGDFYWYHETENYYYLGVIDCTGHGVPGALLSIVGDMLLNEIMGSKHEPDPAYILEQLHENVRNVLCQNKENSHSRDGMEVALCKINKDFSNLCFSGANRPLYLLSNDQEYPLELIRPTRKGIGGKQKEEKRVFDNFTVNLKNYDSMYILSDGFVDQNNLDNKKFGSKQLKELIIKSRDLTADEQKKILLDNFTKYKQNETQRDDITLIGVHFRKGKE